MTQSPTDAIVYGLRVSKKLVHRFVDDLKPDEFEYQPCPGANCVAWLLGHLALTDRRALAWIGAADLPPLPAGFEDRFQVTRTTAADQGGYGDPAGLIRLFDAHRDRLIAAILAADPARFTEPPAAPNPLFADRGESLLFYGLHTVLHAGQFTIIRRMLGYPPVT